MALSVIVMLVLICISDAFYLVFSKRIFCILLICPNSPPPVPSLPPPMKDPLFISPSKPLMKLFKPRALPRDYVKDHNCGEKYEGINDHRIHNLSSCEI